MGGWCQESFPREGETREVSWMRAGIEVGRGTVGQERGRRKRTID